MGKKTIITFCFGLVLGAAPACVGTLYAARAVSPLWAHGQDLAHAFDLQVKAKEAYRAGKLEDALVDMQRANAFYAVPYAPNSQESRWSLSMPTIPLTLSLAGIDWTEFPYGVKGYKPLWEDQCAETFIFLKLGDTAGLERILKNMETSYPNLNRKKCESIGAVMMGVAPDRVDAEVNASTK